MTTLTKRIIVSVAFLVVALGVWFYVTREPTNMVDISSAVATSTVVTE